jgi:NADPH-dependent 2,4-dienoyl-CoA reductase/sulfur reductase-like enzyme
MRTIIIGGVAGGASAATRLRRLDESHEILVLERSGYVSFANCGLPYYIGGTIADRRALLLQTPRSLNARFGLDVRVNSEVTAIDPAARTVMVRDLVAGTTYTEAYDTLVLSPGASPIVPPIPGVERAMTLRTVEDTDRIKATVDRLLAVVDSNEEGVKAGVSAPARPCPRWSWAAASSAWRWPRACGSGTWRSRSSSSRRR